jgi:hypothetical protein
VKATRQVFSAAGTEFTYYEGPPNPAPDVDFNGDICLRTQLYTYRMGDKIVAGETLSVMFSIDRPAKDVWPHLKDFNLWQNAYGHYYTGVVGDLEGKPFRIGSKPADPSAYYPNGYEVVRAIPEQLIAISQPTPPDGSNGGVSPGFHVFLLYERAGKTIISVLMNHASGHERVSEDEALAFWRQETPEYQRKWRDVFIPALKRLVYDR